MIDKPNCYMCEHRKDADNAEQSGMERSGCANESANVVGVFHGVQSGWFYWPDNFNPLWLESCDGFTRK